MFSVMTLATCCVQAAVLLEPSMRTIGGAVKGVPVAPHTELTLFTFPPGEAGVLTEQWFSIFGGDAPYERGADPIVRMYYDGYEAGDAPSLQYRLFLAHGMSPFGCTDYAGQKNCSDPALRKVSATDSNGFANVNGGSWGGELLGHASAGGAVKNTYRLPFGATHGVRITLELPFAGIAYFYCRGMTNYPLIVGDVQLPAEARLRLHANEAVTVAPHGFLPLVATREGGGSAGMLLQVTLAANSSFIGFMEGCVRALIDGGTARAANVTLSSGTEDYFGGANFFDTGLQQSPNAGVTWVEGENPGPYRMTAYRHHARDPVVWWDGMRLLARNYDVDGVQCGGFGGGRPAGVPPNNHRLGAAVTLEPVTMSSYAWTYEWNHTG